MNHLSTAELLLLAEGELDEARAAHAAGCAQCQAASGRALNDLGSITGVLAETAVSDSEEAKAESWVRLHAALESPARRHVEIEDLLLHLDGEMAPAVSAHLEDCADCHDDLLRAQTLLVDVEHELRALIPDETKQQRLASASRLEKALDSRRSRVLSFPAPWRAVYAAAALLAAGLFGFAWYAQQPTQMALPMVAMAPAAPPVFLTPTVEALAQPVAAQPVAQAPEQIAVAAIDVEPVRFSGGSTNAAIQPSEKALAQEAAPLVALTMEPAALPLASLPKLERPQVEADAPLYAREPSRVVVRDRPLGGLVRSALLEHYGDAARRSFRSARPDLLEGELARYVSEILHADSELLRHAYALNEMLRDAAERSQLSADERGLLRSEARKALSTIRVEEQTLYTKLSEALPRRYWASKGARDNELEAQDLAATSKALLEAALQLDKNLSAVLVDAESSVNFEPETASVGDLLYTVRVSSRNLQERLSVLR